MTRWGADIPYPTLDHYVGRLASKEPYTLARYGDGEWCCILGVYGRRNNNGCEFTPEIGAALRQALANQHPYDYAISKIARRNLGAKIGGYLAKHGLNIHWTIADRLLNESLKGRLLPVIRELREYRILYVGPKHCRGLNRAGFFDYVAYIEPPVQNAIVARERLVGEIVETAVQKNANLIGLSAGLAARVFVDDLWQRLGQSTTIIDFGSIWDGYFKPASHVHPLGSRSYIRSGQFDFEKLRKANTSAGGLRL